jgi:hypothetical protein
MRTTRQTRSAATRVAVGLATILSAAPAAAGEDQATSLREAAQAERSGRLAEASAIYDRVRKASPNDGDAQRGACEIGLRIAAGPGLLSATALDACHKAFLLTHTPRDTRNKVQALLLEKARPGLDTLALASLMADGAIKVAPDQAWGHLARHDIARRLGRADLLGQSRKVLEPFAAHEPLVRAALGQRVGAPPAWVWLLRVLVLLGLIGTIAHAAMHRRASAGSAKTHPDQTHARPAAVLAVLLSLLVPSRALAAPEGMPTMENGQISPFKIDDAHPDEAVKTLQKSTKDPLQLGYLLQDLGAFADAAVAARDYVRAGRYFHAMGLAVPTAFGPRMECDSYEKAGDISKAIPACREVLLRHGADVQDYNHFVDVVLKSPTLPALEPDELEGVIRHLEKEVKGNLPTVLRCKAALRFEDPAGIARCDQAMKSAPAGDATVISIKWGLAMRRHDEPGARLLLAQAEKAGVGADDVARMRTATDEMPGRRSLRAKVLGGLGLFGVIVAFLGVRLLTSVRRRTASQSAA